LRCSRNWGDWACQPEGKSVRKCDELAFDDRRWQTLEGLTMTREDQHALWNGVLENARDFLDSPSGTITLRSDGLDPTYFPEVEGLSFRLLTEAEIAELGNRRGSVEYVRLNTWYGWYRGPVTVWMSMKVQTWQETKTEFISGTSWRARTASPSRYVRVNCRRSSVGWSCTPQ
jgi:hypothetical protein